MTTVPLTDSLKMQKSVLVIGATGGMGLQILNSLSKHQTLPAVHAFCRDPRKLADQKYAYLTSIVKGDARNSEDLRRVLTVSKADSIIVSVGNGDDLSRTDIRTANARALVNVLNDPPFQRVRVAVVSSNGAGGSRIIVGLGIGLMIERHLRHVLRDHSGQEEAFLKSIPNRTLIVRPTALTDGMPTGKALVQFGDTSKAPTIKTDRADVAVYIVREVCEDGFPHGKIVNVTGARRKA